MRIPKPWKRKATGNWMLEVNGKQINLGKDKDEAFKEYKRLIHERGLAPNDSAAYSLHDVVDAYWLYVKRTKKPSTIDQRRGLLQSIRDYFPPTLQAMDVRAFHVDTWLDQRGKLKPSTQAGYITFWVGLLEWAVDSGYITRNPIRNMRKPVPSRRENFLPKSRWRELVNACEGEDLKDLVTFLFDTGCRPQEVMRLTFDDWHGDRFILTLSNSKGSKRQRVIFLPKTAQKIVKRRAKKHGSFGYVFRTPTGKQWTRATVHAQFQKLKEAMKLPWLCATTLRHSFAHYRLQCGQSVEMTAKLLGHTSPVQVLQRYGHMEDGDLLVKEANKVSLPWQQD